MQVEFVGEGGMGCQGWEGGEKVMFGGESVFFWVGFQRISL